MDPHVSQQPLFVLSWLEVAPKACLYTHAVHSIQNLLDSFIIPCLKGNMLTYCKENQSNKYLVWLKRRSYVQIYG